MPYKRPNSPYWWIQYYDATGQQVRQTSGTTDKAEATALERKLKSESHSAKKRVNGVNTAFDAVLAEYLSQPGRLNPRNRSTARHLAAEFQGKSVLDISTKLILQYIEKRKLEVAEGTINKELVMFSAAINEYNRRHGSEIHNPVHGTKLQEPEGRLRWLEKKEMEHLLEFASPEVKDFMIVGFHTGMRAREMMELEWSRVDLTRKTALLDSNHTKTRKRRAIPLHEGVIEAMLRCKERYEDSGMVFGGVKSFRKGFEAACRRAGVKDFSIHDMRHTFASWLAIQGVSLYVIQELLGHASIQMTQRYAHLAPAQLEAAIAKI